LGIRVYKRIPNRLERYMKDLAFGLTVTLVGMGVTLFTLYILILVIRLLDKIFPFKAEEEKKGK
jgi:Na+-transporting methylmalonyl-CoA/oxaloacetate decarboxylase gamma subunit